MLDPVLDTEGLIRGLVESFLQYNPEAGSPTTAPSAFFLRPVDQQDGLSVLRRERVPSIRTALPSRFLAAAALTARAVRDTDLSLDVRPKGNRPEGAVITGLPHSLLFKNVSPDEAKRAYEIADELARSCVLALDPPSEVLERLKQAYEDML